MVFIMEIHTETHIFQGVIWIWDAAVVCGPSVAQTYIFTNDFNVIGIPVDAMMDIAADPGTGSTR